MHTCAYYVFIVVASRTSSCQLSMQCNESIRVHFKMVYLWAFRRLVQHLDPREEW